METTFLRMFCEKTIEVLSEKVMQVTTIEVIKNNFVTEPTKRGNMFYFCFEYENLN